MQLNRLFSVPPGNPQEIELECRLRLDIPHQEIIRIMNKTQVFMFTKAKTIEITDYRNPQGKKNEKYRIIDGRRQSKTVVESVTTNIQGYTVKFDLSIEQYIDFPPNLEVSQIRERSREITPLNNYSELHLTTNKVGGMIDEYVEIEYNYSTADPGKLLDSIKILFDLIYVNSLLLLRDINMLPLIKETNNALLFLKNGKGIRTTDKDKENMSRGQLVNFEDKPVSLDPRKIKDITDSQDYYVTNKLNGIRYLMVVFGDNVYLVSRGGMKRNEVANVWNFLKLDTLQSTTKSGKMEIYIFDGEYYNGRMWIFDVLMYKNNSLVNNPYQQRLYWCTEFMKNNPSEKISMKVIYKVNDQKLDINNLIEYCQKVFGSQWDWENDGLIFSHGASTYADRQLKTYKWKFPHHQTIDVSVENSIKSSGKYMYNIGVVDKNSTTALVDILYKQKPLYNPLPLENKSVVEVQWVGGEGGALIPFSFIKTRSRPDKTYPNYIDTANSVWGDIKNPIPMGALTSKTLYVWNKRTEWLEYRKYSNYRKDSLIREHIKRSSTILDIGFGKGGDILKYKNAGVQKIYAFEPDSVNVSEFFTRYKIDRQVIPGNYYTLVVEGIKIILFHRGALDLGNPAIRQLIVDPIDTVCLFFSLTYFFGALMNFTNLFNSISYLSGKRKIIGTVMDGKKALNMIKNYKWDPAGAGLEIKVQKDQVYIKLEESQTVRGHWEYLVEWIRLRDYLELYGYKCKVSPYDYRLDPRGEPLNYSLVEKFAALNIAFVFEIDPNLKPINNIFLRQCIYYNQRLALPKDSMFFIGCNKDILAIPGQLDGLLEGKPLQKLFIEYKTDGKILVGDLEIRPDQVDSWRSYLIMSKNSDIPFFKFEQEISFDREKYHIQEPVKITNTILPLLCNNLDRVCEIIKENISPATLKDIYDLSFTCGIFSMKFANIFGKVKTLIGNRLEGRITSYNIGLLPPQLMTKVQIVTQEQLNALKDAVIFIDKFIFGGEFEVLFKTTTNTVIVRTPVDKFQSLPPGFTKIYYLGGNQGFIVFYN